MHIWLYRILKLMLAGGMFLTLNLIADFFLVPFGISTQQVFTSVMSGTVEFGIMLLYIPVVLLLWGVFVAVIHRVTHN